jgi:hypothetical protein
MKALILHDERGNIVSLGVPGREFGGRLSLLPEQGQQVTEMELPGVMEDIMDETNLQPLLDLLEHYRLEFGDEEPKFVRK